VQTTVGPADYDAVLFDLDGVLTSTRTVHMAAWKHTFDTFLETWDAEHGTTTERFREPQDYAEHVDGKPRQEGVRDFLASRGIELPEGTPDSPAAEVSVWGLGNRKQILVEAELSENGVEVFPGSIAWVRQLRDQGMRTAVVSSSRNCKAVLESAQIADLFDARVDGETSLELGLPGKPAPDGFLEGARRVGVSPARAVVVEDAIAGVQAGRAGRFGLVIGVDREDNAAALAENGADIVVDDLSELVSEDAARHPIGPKAHRLIQAASRILASGESYPSEPFRLVERAYNPEYTAQTETLFALGNGYLGIRGSFEEGEPSYQPGTLLNGYYETRPISYAEDAFGFARVGQTVLNVPDGTRIRLFVDDDPLDCAHTEVLEFQRTLDMEHARLDRSVVYQLPGGRRYWVKSSRFVSLAHRHLACVRYEVTALDEPTTLTVSSELVTHYRGEESDDDPRRGLGMPRGVYEPLASEVDGARAMLALRTENSGLTMACGMEHEIAGEAVEHVGTTVDGDSARSRFRIEAEVGRPVVITKWIAYHHGPHEASELLFRTTNTLDRASSRGYAEEVRRHQTEVEQFWRDTDIQLEGTPMLQQAVRLSLFAVLQATRRVEGHGVAAKGVTGLGYEGHYFWDTEVYVMPVLIHTKPDLARSLLLFRYAMLEAARRRAREVGQKGALFPWRTISGDEASAYYAAGTAQYHINADIAYAVNHYVQVSGDLDFLHRYGTEMLIETARLWYDLGFFSPAMDGQFVINAVTGPDEYTTVVDNNLYTNMMAAENLRLAVDAVERTRQARPDQYRRLLDVTGLRHSELDDWRRAAENMHVPYDEKVGVHLQDDAFLHRKIWDFENTPPEKYPLLLHFHPLFIYRHQVIKQADVVLATVLLRHMFTPEQSKRIFEYYDPLTTGDSSLSESIQSIAAAEAGEWDAAGSYLTDAVSVDISDRAGNVRDGMHVASAGGTWMALVYGFAGMQDYGDAVRFRPRLPIRARRMAFRVRVRGANLAVEVAPHEATYTLLEGAQMTIHHYGETRTLVSDTSVTLPIPESEG
jgi:alpha,alpha-trehalose phosphorylase